MISVGCVVGGNYGLNILPPQEKRRRGGRGRKIWLDVCYVMRRLPPSQSKLLGGEFIRIFQEEEGEGEEGREVEGEGEEEDKISSVRNN